MAPTLLQPLPLEREIRDQVDPALWRDFVARPSARRSRRASPTTPCAASSAAGALIGTFASLHDPSLLQNRCFLYHLIGNGTGEWRVPVGGLGAVTDALARAAAEAGAEIVTSAGVSAINAADDGAEVTWHDGTASHTSPPGTCSPTSRPGCCDPARRARGPRPPSRRARS